MPRPVKWRKIEHLPKYRFFKPSSIPAYKLEENTLKIEELEAVRLKDLEGLNQKECADKMKVSRQTFQRIYNSAKKKIADSLVNGKAISIKGGNYTKNICRLACNTCGHMWQSRVEDVEENEDVNECPECSGMDVNIDIDNEGFMRRNRRGRHRGHGRCK